MTGWWSGGAEWCRVNVVCVTHCLLFEGGVVFFSFLAGFQGVPDNLNSILRDEPTQGEDGDTCKYVVQSGREEGPTQQQLETVSTYVRAYASIVMICTPFLIKFASKDLSG